ncbi:choline-phosphate cytidylyltransferase [Entomortierella chlamydospora]|uniref:choline-phosphate cytidylyltransferase n=1 Tax=Entomortierella chlamydospora TaxID=101097 RepID=A0A9P6MVI7_9FUNG|nr:choline-phosphate cytidylyltransferase [Entomortierella chlamydospora]KAG0015026.1 choline-phosphate cytidylyltransferase [Entomortierella chlamydospora]
MSSKRKRSDAASATSKNTNADASMNKQPRISQKSTSTKNKNSRRRAQEEAEDEENKVDVEQERNDQDEDMSKDEAKDSTPKSESSATSVSSSSTKPKYSYPINPPPEGRPVRIYCDGIYDLFHFGHAKALEQAKKAFPEVYLLVGVCDDTMTHSRKGKTVMTDKERYESVRHCKWVDEVIEAAPWVVDQAFLDKHKIDYVAHDDIPYKSVDSDDVYAFVKNQGYFLPTQRTDGVSTSDLITRIVKDYDQYLRRNLERGVTAKELGIGFFKEQEVKFKKSAQDIRASIRQNWHGTKDELKNEISVLRNDLRQTMNMWEDKSQEIIKDFSKLFGADSVVNKIFRRRRRGVDNLITDGSLSGTSNTSSRVASPEGSDLEDGSTSPFGIGREFFRFGRNSSNNSESGMQRSRSISSVDSNDEQSP